MTIWGITTFFNPVRYSNKLRLYREFRARFPLPLLAVELSRDGTFELDDTDADIVLRFRGETRLFQKEAMINAGVAHLPPPCDVVCWTDADLIWDSDAWVDELPRALADTVLVQPFDHCVRLPQGGTVDDYLHRHDLRVGGAEGETQPGFAYWLNRVGRTELFKRYVAHPGFVWAARRETLEAVPLYPYHVLGGNDTIMAYGAVNVGPRFRNTTNRRFIESIDRWREMWFGLVQGRLGYCKGRVFHLWHGDMRNRRYHKRYALLDQIQFDPESSLHFDDNGLLACRSERLAALGESQFVMRQEEGAVV